jgi:regulator of sigma E protease
LQVEDKDGKNRRGVEVPVGGFSYDDEIIGMTKVVEGKDYDPFDVSDLRHDSDRDRHDYFDFAQRMQQLAGKVVVVKVHRKDKAGSTETLSILVPPAFYSTLPVMMKMGEVVSVRDGSPAAKAGLKEGDIIRTIQLRSGTKEFTWPGSLSGERRDPLRLPHELRKWAKETRPEKGSKDAAPQVTITVERDGKPKDLDEADWEYGWEFEQEFPFGPASPLAISELGIAYRAGPTLDTVEEAADDSGLEAGDKVYSFRYRMRSKGDEGELKWSPWMELGKDAKEKPEAWWPFVFMLLQSEDDLRHNDEKQIEVRVTREGDSKEYKLAGTPDPTWPLDERGFHFQYDWVLKKGSSPLDAIVMGLRRTFRGIGNMYLSFRSMGTGRLPIDKNLRGPVSIVTMAYEVAGVDWPTFLIFLGMINISLAVVNFLPIPVLDGGHMVFLIYEKIRGKPASETVRFYLTCAGLALLLVLMVYVFYLDIARLLGFNK